MDDHRFSLDTCKLSHIVCSIFLYTKQKKSQNHPTFVILQYCTTALSNKLLLFSNNIVIILANFVIAKHKHFEISKNKNDNDYRIKYTLNEHLI